MGSMKCKACVTGADAAKSGGSTSTPTPAASVVTSERLLQRTLAAVLSRRILGVPAACAAAAAASIHPIPEVAFAPQPLGPEEAEHTFMESVRTVVETSGMVFLSTAFNPPNATLPTYQDGGGGGGVSLACHNHEDKEEDESDSEEGRLLSTFDAVLLHNARASVIDTAPPATPTLRDIQRLCCSRSPPQPPTSTSNTSAATTSNEHQTSPQPPPSSFVCLLYTSPSPRDS
eukprot:TRINITY_DN51945_c0_g1_i2.p1 TRINITY_DN51945_c0_g1~~TRINITY_DN51945_c0_g1_i2.p1  ORF type:complete len:231 (+),score=43.90 TRINITY_DN51945_c0_g1_i2:98-790(+)